jgi:glycosyltransferase 2 family protein
MQISFTSYAFNLNLGSLVGGVAFRYRLYAKFGLSNDVVPRVLGLSMLTNWLGYMLLAGTVFLIRPLELPAEWIIGEVGLRVLGGVLLALVITYLVLCFRATRRKWSLRGHEVTLPGGRLALLQLGLSALNWTLIATIVYVLLQQKIGFTTVLSVMLIAAVAGVIAHVPAGLGVLEAVFVTLLAQSASRTELLAALLAYRAIYYLAPLALAVVYYFFVGKLGRESDGAKG